MLSGPSGRESGRPSEASHMGLLLLAPFYLCEEEGSLINKNLMHNFREKEGNKPSLALLAESKTGRDKLGLKEGACAFLPVSAIRSSLMKLEPRKL